MAFPFSYEAICAAILEKLSFLFALSPTALIDAFESNGGGVQDASEDSGGGTQKTAGMGLRILHGLWLRLGTPFCIMPDSFDHTANV